MRRNSQLRAASRSAIYSRNADGDCSSHTDIDRGRDMGHPTVRRNRHLPSEWTFLASSPEEAVAVLANGIAAWVGAHQPQAQEQEQEQEQEQPDYRGSLGRLFGR